MFEYGLKLHVKTPFSSQPLVLWSLNFIERQLISADYVAGHKMLANWEPDFQVIKAELTDREGKVVGDGAKLLAQLVKNLTLSAQNDKTAKGKR